jgi:outer membrane immunogenic protein
VTGGGAWARNEIAISVAVGGLAAGVVDTQNHMGYAVGGGWEYAFAPNWSTKIEYLYLDYGSENYFQSQLGVGIASGDLDMHTIKFGVNYRFGG